MKDYYGLSDKNAIERRLAELAQQGIAPVMLIMEKELGYAPPSKQWRVVLGDRRNRPTSAARATAWMH